MCKSHFHVFVKKRVWWNFSELNCAVCLMAAGFGALYLLKILSKETFIAVGVLSCWANKSFTLNSFRKSNQRRRRFTTIHSRMNNIEKKQQWTAVKSRSKSIREFKTANNKYTTLQYSINDNDFNFYFIHFFSCWCWESIVLSRFALFFKVRFFLHFSFTHSPLLLWNFFFHHTQITCANIRNIQCDCIVHVLN